MDAFAWPAAVLIIVVFALIIFRKEISSLLNRTKEIGTSGLKAYDTPPTQPTDEKKSVDEFFRSFENPLLLEAEELILNDLKNRKIETSQEREKTLLRALASTNLLLHFERVHGTIWLSQLAALRYLNQRDTGAERADLYHHFYETAKAAYPNWYENYSFDQWLEFLQSFTLVALKDSRLFISVAGREFLQYLTATGKSDPYYG